MTEDRFTVHRDEPAEPTATDEIEPMPVRWCGQDTDHDEHAWRTLGVFGGGQQHCAGYERHGFWWWLDANMIHLTIALVVICLTISELAGR